MVNRSVFRATLGPERNTSFTTKVIFITKAVLKTHRNSESLATLRTHLKQENFFTEEDVKERKENIVL